MLTCSSIISASASEVYSISSRVNARVSRLFRCVCHDILQLFSFPFFFSYNLVAFLFAKTSTLIVFISIKCYHHWSNLLTWYITQLMITFNGYVFLYNNSERELRIVTQQYNKVLINYWHAKFSLFGKKTHRRFFVYFDKMNNVYLKHLIVARFVSKIFAFVHSNCL